VRPEPRSVDRDIRRPAILKAVGGPGHRREKPEDEEAEQPEGEQAEQPEDEQAQNRGCEKSSDT